MLHHKNTSKNFLTTTVPQPQNKNPHSPTLGSKAANINVKKLTCLKIIVRTMWWYHSAKKTAEIFWVTPENVHKTLLSYRIVSQLWMGQLMDAPCVTPSRVTQKVSGVISSRRPYNDFYTGKFFTFILYRCQLPGH